MARLAICRPISSSDVGFAKARALYSVGQDYGTLTALSSPPALPPASSTIPQPCGVKIRSANVLCRRTTVPNGVASDVGDSVAVAAGEARRAHGALALDDDGEGGPEKTQTYDTCFLARSSAICEMFGGDTPNMRAMLVRVWKGSKERESLDFLIGEHLIVMPLSLGVPPRPFWCMSRILSTECVPRNRCVGLTQFPHIAPMADVEPARGIALCASSQLTRMSKLATGPIWPPDPIRPYPSV